jgi:hypothetical protein
MSTKGVLVPNWVDVQQTNASIYRDLIVARDFVYVDWTQVDANLEKAFGFQSSIRVHDAQVWATDKIPVSNGAKLEAKPSVPVPGLPTIEGSIAGFEALDAHGNPTGWNTAAAIALTIVATANVTVPKGQITAGAAAVNPALGAIVGAALLFAPGNISLNIGHTQISVPIARSGGRITHIGTVQRP